MSHKSSSKTTYVTCRAEFCGKSIVKQNYKIHLEAAHPELNSNDLRSKGQPMLSFPLKRKASESSEDEGENNLLIGRSSVVKKCVNECIDVESENTSIEPEHLCTVTNVESPDCSGDEDCTLMQHKAGILECMTKPDDSQSKSMRDESETNRKLDMVLQKLNTVETEMKQMRAAQIPHTNIDVKPDNSSISIDTDVKPNVSNFADSPVDLLDEMIMGCKSIEQLKANLPEFQCIVNDVSSAIEFICDICIQNGPDAPASTTNTTGHFTYQILDEYDSHEHDKGQKFRNLKRSLKRHIITQTHKDSLSDISVKTASDLKVEKREKDIGMRLARMAYHLFKRGRPDTDFPEHVVLHHLNGVDVGNINHSDKFVSKFLPFVGEEVKKKLIKFLTSRLPQTGCVPIGKIVADKATSKHRTRHFICFITCVPDSENLIQALFLEINIVKGHTGNIKNK